MKSLAFSIVGTGLLLNVLAAKLGAEEAVLEKSGLLKQCISFGSGLLNRGDGHLYGVSLEMEGQPQGNIFRVAPGGEIDVLHQFDSLEAGGDPNEGGANPKCLALGPDGSFYGITSYGGTYGEGVVFRFSPDGIYSVVSNLSLHLDRITIDQEGIIYGITSTGGPKGGGCLFRIDANGVVRLVYAFESVSPSWQPVVPGEKVPPFSPSNVFVGKDGNIYGLTFFGGPAHPQYTPFGFYRASHGTLFRYDGPDAITVLTEFDAWGAHGVNETPVDDGFIVATSKQLLHVGLEGDARLEFDFASVDQYGDVYPGPLMETDAGLFGITSYGGQGNGFFYRFVPGEGIEILYDFQPEGYGYQRVFAPGADGWIHGLVTAPLKTGPKRQTPGANLLGTEYVRLLTGSGPDRNIVPVTHLDVVWLPEKASPQGQREVDVEVLANDVDPDRDPLLLLGVDAPDAGIAKIVPSNRPSKVRFSTTEEDPASRLLTYQVADGKGGISDGYVAVRSQATGSFQGSLQDSVGGDAGVVDVELGTHGSVSVSLQLGGISYKGAGVSDVNDTAGFALHANGQPPIALHVALHRGATRNLTALLEANRQYYTANCAAVPEN